MTAKEFTEITGRSMRSFAMEHGIDRGTVAEAIYRGYSKLTPKNSYGKKHELYHTYRAMINRTTNKLAPDYLRYGGRGITMCGVWYYSFDQFVIDMGDRPKNHTIDRIDNSKGYSPANCRWATAAEQVQNSSLVVVGEDKVRAIRKQLYEGMDRKGLYLTFPEINKRTMRDIINFKTWKEV